MLFRSIQDEYDVVARPEGTRAFGVSRVDGLMNLEDFAEETGIELPDGPYETVAGYLVSRLGTLPRIGDVVEQGGHRLEVAELDGRRVSRILVTPAPPVEVRYPDVALPE